MVKDLHGTLCDRYAGGATSGTSTTLAACVVDDAICDVTNVGDSRVYPISGRHGLKQLSRDHSMINKLPEKDQGYNGFEIAGMRDGLACSLTADHDEDVFQIHRERTSVVAGDDLLLCSDGLHETLGDARLKALYGSHLLIVAMLLLLDGEGECPCAKKRRH